MIALIAITPQGQLLARRLSTLMPIDCYTSDKLICDGFIGFGGDMSACIQRLFSQYRALVFICATGIVVRMIAPLVVDKCHDPAVLVMDEKGQYIISLLSGHVGGGNALTRQIATLLAAKAVITTATDVNEVAALDILAQQIDAVVTDYRASVKTINQLLISQKRVGLYIDPLTGIPLQQIDTRGFDLINDLSLLQSETKWDAIVLISFQKLSNNKFLIAQQAKQTPLIRVIPRQIVIGMGCRRDTDPELIYHNVCAHLDQQDIDLSSIKKLGSVAIKQNELGLIALATRLQIPFVTYPVTELTQPAQHFEVSAFVMQTIGVGSVAQPVAWLMSKGNMLGSTFKQQGMTISLGVSECCIS